MSSLKAQTSGRTDAALRTGARRGPGASYAAAPLGRVERAAEPTPLRLLTTPRTDEPRGDALPVLATPGDLREAVQYLKRKPAGASLAEALADSKRRAFEPRKVAAYEAWGLVARRGHKILLTTTGLAFARTLEPATRAYRTMLDANRLYRATLEWVHRQGLDLVTCADVAAFLRDEFGALVASAGAKATGEGVVCFFHLCQAAEVGTVTIGKRGQPARMRVEREGLDEYIDERGASPTRNSRPSSGEARAHEDAYEPAGDEEETTAGTRLFITYGTQPAHLVAQIQTVFELAGIGSHASERAPSGGGAMLVAEEAAEVMRRCDAALVLLSAEDCRPDESGAPAVARRALVEIGAASVLYKGRVLLLLDGPLEVPAGLAALPRVTLAGGGLTWEAGIELLKAVRGFAVRA
ncbi:MAG TPA: hypothetical protein VJ866_10745 [Pyrinomonadaceae bacterium]|nr:hypothetical protein [Pyrinomonadaceae bacterium]